MTNRTERLAQTAENAKGSNIYWLILLISIFTSFTDEIGEIFHFLGRRKQRDERQPTEGEGGEPTPAEKTAPGTNWLLWIFLAAVAILIVLVLWQPEFALKIGVIALAICIRIAWGLYQSFNKSPKERAQRRARALRAAGFNIGEPEGYKAALKTGKDGLDNLAKPHIDDAFDNILLEEEEE